MVRSDAEDPLVPTTPVRSSLDMTTPRPPTPPKESPRAKNIVDQSLVTSSGNQMLHLVSSPVSSRDPSPPSDSADSVSEKPPKKRVGWSGWTTYHKPDTPLTPSTSRVRPSASTNLKSLKSILKQTSSPFRGATSPPLDQPFVAHSYASFSHMLESVIEALASTERSKKLDTYIAFCNTLRAYDDIPDWSVMERRLSMICGAMRRDLAAKMEDGGNLDSQLTQQATKLLTILCWYERLANAMDDSSASFFVLHAIQKIEDPQTSKASVTLYLHFLAQQRFPTKTMTVERCNRLVTALETLDERITGKSITKERIDIYYKLLSQSRTVMVARAPDWMRNAFGGLLNHIKEVRTRSLIFLREAALVMGKDKAVARTISSIFNQDNDGKRMFESIRSRLDHFVKKEHEGQYVSQLWAVLLLLTQSVGDKWDFFTPWLRIIETCFNVSEPEVKVEAQLAWSKLIYVSNIGPNTQRKLLELMCKPVEQYLDPRNASLNTRKPRKAALSNVCVYLYYGFRPSASAKQLSEIWEVVVVGLIQNLVLAGSEAMDGCNILCSLFDGTTPKRWSEDRLLIGHPFMKTEEVPRLDPKWVRSNCEKVLTIVEVALRRTTWEDTDAPGARLVWKRFTRILADAGNKEIKIVPELMEAVSCLFNMFQRMWGEAPENLEPVSGFSFIERFTFLVETALDSLGTLCFTEKQLALDEKSRFIPASTPIHKYQSDSNNGHRLPPLLHIVRLLVEPPPGIPVDEQYFNCARRILSKCCVSQDSRRKKLHLLASCETLLPRREINAVHLGLWDILAELTRGALPAPAITKALLSPSPLGGEFKDAVTVLAWGSQQYVSEWENLFKELVEVVQGELGNAYVAANIIAPLAESLRTLKLKSRLLDTCSLFRVMVADFCFSGLNVERTVILLRNASIAKKKPTIESMFKGHRGLGDQKSANTDSLESLYALANSSLLQTYESSDKEFTALGVDLCKAVLEFITRSPSGSMAPLKQMQEGLGLWAKDPSNQNARMNGFSAMAATKLWENVLQAVESLPRHDSEILSDLNVLLSSGLESRRKSTVNITIKTWNNTFGKQESLSYPSRVRMALARLRTITDLSLPGFPEDDSGVFTPPEFTESQDAGNTQSVADIQWSSPTPARQLFPNSRARTSTPTSVIRETPARGRPRSNQPTPTPTKRMPKPKHMDSQLDFVAIEGTPSLEAQDSQLITEHQKEVREEQAQAAVMFPELIRATPAASKRETMKVGDESPTSKRRNQTPIGSQSHGYSDKIPETTIKESTMAPDFMVSFISESHIGSRSPSVSGSVRRKGNNEATIPREMSSELTDLDMGGDTPMADYSETSMEKPAPGPPAGIPPDGTSDDEPFVDAPDHFPQPEVEEPERPSPVRKKARVAGRVKDTSEVVTLVVPPMRNSEDIRASMSTSMSDASTSVACEADTPATPGTPRSRSNKKRAKKRKRGSSLPQEPKPSLPVLDTVEVVVEAKHSLMASHPPPLAPVSPETERSSKRVKSADTNDTPVKTRVSARKNKGRKPPRGLVSALDSSRKDLDERSEDPAPSPTPMRTRNASKRVRSPKKAAVEEKDVSFIGETQFDSFVSSVADSQPPPAAAAAAKFGSTPTKSRKAKGLFANDEYTDELQVRSPRHSLSEASNSEIVTPRSARRSKRRSTLASAMMKSAATPEADKETVEESEPAIQQVEESKPTIQQVEEDKEQPVAASPPAMTAMEAIRKALAMVDGADLTVAEISTVEDEVFEAFSRLREKKKTARQ